MSFNSSPTLVLELPSSRQPLYVSAALSVCGLLFLVVSWLGLLRTAMSFAVILCLISFAAAWMSFNRSSASSLTYRISKLVWRQEGDWVLQVSDGQNLSAELLSSSWVTSIVWCLRFQTAERKLPAIVVWRSQYSDVIWQSWLTRLHLHSRTRSFA